MRAFERGINFFDTANVYARGRAEEVVGRAIAQFDRDDLVLATKVYFPMGDGPNDRGLSRKHIREQIDRSLTRLGTPYIDLYQCHRYDVRTPLEETCAAMNDLVRLGKILVLGRLGMDGGSDRRGRDAVPRAGLVGAGQQSTTI